MKITNILIEDKIKEKLLWKHNIKAIDIKEVLFNNPHILKVSKNRYMAIGHNHKFVTIIFEVINGIAFIVTSYPSSDAQRKLYKQKRG